LLAVGKSASISEDRRTFLAIVDCILSVTVSRKEENCIAFQEDVVDD